MHTIHHCFPAVKLRAKVIEVAYQYFRLPRSKRLRIIEGDAIDFVVAPGEKKTDILFADLYTAEGVDARQTQQDFIRQCHQLLKPEGLLVLNCWREHRYEYAVQEVLQELFADVRVCITGSGNWVIIASRKSLCESNKALKQRAQKLSSQLGFNVVAMLGRLEPLAEAERD